MPQISQISEIFASQLFWLIVSFGLIYAVIGRGMLPKIEATVDQRDRRISDDLAAAERLGLLAFVVAMILLFVVGG